MTSQFRKLRDQVGDEPELRMVSFTIDPARDTPEALATYGRSFGANPDKWYFLTGAQKDLHHLEPRMYSCSVTSMARWSTARDSS